MLGIQSQVLMLAGKHFLSQAFSRPLKLILVLKYS